jgi:hypothetical protein
MNTKFFFVLLIIVIIATACTPAIVDSSVQPAEAMQLVNDEPSASIPVTGKSDFTTTRDVQESRPWSGEIYFSDNNSPDYMQNAQPAATGTPQAECMSDDSQPKRQSGCLE